MLGTPARQTEAATVSPALGTSRSASTQLRQRGVANAVTPEFFSKLATTSTTIHCGWLVGEGRSFGEDRGAHEGKFEEQRWIFWSSCDALFVMLLTRQLSRAESMKQFWDPLSGLLEVKG